MLKSSSVTFICSVTFCAVKVIHKVETSHLKQYKRNNGRYIVEEKLHYSNASGIKLVAIKGNKTRSLQKYQMYFMYWHCEIQKIYSTIFYNSMPKKVYMI